MEVEGKPGEAAIQMEPYRDPASSRDSRIREYAPEEGSEDSGLNSQDAPLLALPAPSLAKRRRRNWTPWRLGRIWTRWTVIPLFVVAMIISYSAGAGTAPRLPSWVKDRMPKFLLLDDIYETNPGLLPSHRPYTNAADDTVIDLPHSCQFIPEETYDLLISTPNPLIQVVAQNESVTSATNLTTPVSVCVLVSIPQHEFRNGSYPDAPVPNKGPDTIHMYLNSSDVIITFPPMLPLPDQMGASAQYFPGNIIYFAETPIFNAGNYVVNADVEFSNWLWAQEWHAVGLNFTTRTGEPPGDLEEDHKYKPVSLSPVTFSVEGSRHLPSRPLCDATTNAGQGRWYRYRSFPVLDRDLVDEWGYTWQGDACHLDFYSPIDSLDCLEGKTVHVYGDSMMRRMSKTMMSGGKWCLDPFARCQDEDDTLDGLIPKLDVDADGGIVVDEFLREEHFQRGDLSAISFGKNTSVYFTFVTALAVSGGTWMTALYNERDRFLLPGAGADLPPDAMGTVSGAIARPPPEMAPADLVILGFGAWDQAFTDRFDQYEEQLVHFRDAFLQAYKGVPILLRLSNQWCCRGTHALYRRYTGSRIQEFDARTRKVFQVDGATAMDGRIRVMDPAMMNGRPDVIHGYRPSKANHPRASHVRIEMQMMMNSLCKRKENGMAEFNEFH